MAADDSRGDGVPLRAWSLEFDNSQDTVALFGRSIPLVLETTAREYSADAASLYEFLESRGTLRLRGRSGTADFRLDRARIELPERSTVWLRQLALPETVYGAKADARTGNFPEVLLHGLEQLQVAPLRRGEALLGFLTVGWRNGNAAAANIGSAAAATAALLERIRESDSAVSLAARVAQTEADLADQKIAEHTADLLRSGGAGRTERLREHIHRMLQKSETALALERQLSDLQVQLRDREVIAQAKARLQAKHQLTEEQAYFQLRSLSRRQRRPIRDVAADVLRI